MMKKSRKRLSRKNLSKKRLSRKRLSRKRLSRRKVIRRMKGGAGADTAANNTFWNAFDRFKANPTPTDYETFYKKNQAYEQFITLWYMIHKLSNLITKIDLTEYNTAIVNRTVNKDRLDGYFTDIEGVMKNLIDKLIVVIYATEIKSRFNNLKNDIIQDKQHKDLELLTNLLISVNPADKQTYENIMNVANNFKKAIQIKDTYTMYLKTKAKSIIVKAIEYFINVYDGSHIDLFNELINYTENLIEEIKKLGHQEVNKEFWNDFDKFIKNITDKDYNALNTKYDSYKKFITLWYMIHNLEKLNNKIMLSSYDDVLKDRRSSKDNIDSNYLVQIEKTIENEIDNLINKIHYEIIEIFKYLNDDGFTDKDYDDLQIYTNLLINILPTESQMFKNIITVATNYREAIKIKDSILDSNNKKSATDKINNDIDRFIKTYYTINDNFDNDIKLTNELIEDIKNLAPTTPTPDPPPPDPPTPPTPDPPTPDPPTPDPPPTDPKPPPTDSLTDPTKDSIKPEPTKTTTKSITKWTGNCSCKKGADNKYNCKCDSKSSGGRKRVIKNKK